MTRKLISSGSEFEEKIGYSRAVVDGDYVFVSGNTGYNETSFFRTNPLQPTCILFGVAVRPIMPALVRVF